MKVTFLDLGTQNQRLKDEVLPLWEEILCAASFVGGAHVEMFEEEFAAACSMEYCVTVNSGTDALRLIFLALGVEAGDEVITVPNTFIATTEAISQAGGKIVFVDVDPCTYNMDSSRIEDVITPRTKGIVPVHLYGQTADMDPILKIAEKHRLWVVEDACQAHLAEYKGRKAGSMGTAAAFSFYPGKNLGACGEAGAVVTGDADVARKVRILRDHGQGKKYYHDVEGFNCRCDAIQAAALRVKLKYLPEWNEARTRRANLYFELLGNVSNIVLPTVLDTCMHVFHLFVIQVEERDRVAEGLKRKGIDTGLHYPIPLHLQKAYGHLGLKQGSFPVSETCSQSVLSLPIYPDLNDRQISHVCSELSLLIASK